MPLFAVMDDDPPNRRSPPAPTGQQTSPGVQMKLEPMFTSYTTRRSRLSPTWVVEVIGGADAGFTL